MSRSSRFVILNRMMLIAQQTKILLSVIITAVLILVAGHFCLINTVNIAHAHSEPPHEQSVVDQDDMQTCCQQENATNLNAIAAKSNTTGDQLIVVQTVIHYTQLLQSRIQLAAPDPDISPHQFLCQSFRILLC